VRSYVVRDPVTASITDMFGFRVVNDRSQASVFAIIPMKTPARQLNTDLLLYAKQENLLMIVTPQFGLAREHFEGLLVHGMNHYWHIYNYAYPEVDEENFCIFQHA